MTLVSTHHLSLFLFVLTLVSTHHFSLFLTIHISRMECQFHELSYMKASLELMEVKEEIDHLIREKRARPKTRSEKQRTE